MLLVDTSVWIDFFNGYASLEADRLTAAIADNEPVIVPDFILMEILAGLRSEAEADRIAHLMEAFDKPPPMERADYFEAAVIFRTCRTKGHTIRSLIDCLIARLCLSHNFTLLSRDRDFAKINAAYPKLRLA